MVVSHNLTDVNHPSVSLGLRDTSYPLASHPAMLLQTNTDDMNSMLHRVPLGRKPGTLRSGDVGVSTVNTASRRRLLSYGDTPERIPMSSSNSYIYYTQLAVGTPRQKNIHVILDTGSSVFAIFAVPHGGPSALVIFLLVAAAVLAAAAVGLLILSWWQGNEEEEISYSKIKPDYGSTDDI